MIQDFVDKNAKTLKKLLKGEFVLFGLKTTIVSFLRDSNYTTELESFSKKFEKYFKYTPTDFDETPFVKTGLKLAKDSEWDADNFAPALVEFLSKHNVDGFETILKIVKSVFKEYIK